LILEHLYYRFDLGAFIGLILEPFICPSLLLSIWSLNPLALLS
jgi:hypothetical protein